MSDVYEQERGHLNDFVEGLSWTEGQCGAVFAIDGAIAGLELFDCAETMRKLYSKLVRSYALDAMDHRQGPDTEVAGGNAGEFLEAVKRSQIRSYEAVGLGEDVRVSDSNLTGGALIVDGRCVHLSAFSRRQRRDPSDHRESRMSRASARGRQN